MKRILRFLPSLAAFGCGQLLGVDEFHGGSGAGGASASSGSGGTRAFDACPSPTPVSYQVVSPFLLKGAKADVAGVASSSLSGNGKPVDGRVFGGTYFTTLDYDDGVTMPLPQLLADHGDASFLFALDASDKAYGWAQAIYADTGGGFAHVIDVAADTAASVVAVAGNFHGALQAPLSGASAASDNQDAFIAEYDNAGSFKRVATIAGDGTNGPSAIAVRLVGANSVLLGSNNGALNAGSGIMVGNSPSGSYGFVVAHLANANSLNAAWLLLIQGSGGTITPTGLAIPSTGKMTAAVGLASTANQTNAVSLVENSHAQPTKFDSTPSGNALFVAVASLMAAPPPPQFVKVFGGPFTRATVDFDASGDPIVAATVDFGDAQDRAVTIDGETISFDNPGLLVMRLDAMTGAVKWAKRFLTTNGGGSVLLKAERASTDGVWITGGFGKQLDFGGTAQIGSFALGDGFAALLDDNGCGRYALDLQPSNPNKTIEIHGVAPSPTSKTVYIGCATSGSIGPIMNHDGPYGCSAMLVPAASP